MFMLWHSHLHSQWIWYAADVLIRKMIIYFRWYHIISMSILLLLGYWFIFCLDFLACTRAQEKLRHGEQHFTLTLCYIAHITVMSHEGYDASNHWQHDCLCMIRLVEQITQKIPTLCSIGPNWWDSMVPPHKAPMIPIYLKSILNNQC